MFTGIVQQTSEIVSTQKLSTSVMLTINLGALSQEVQIGDSVLTDGVCLTATSVDDGICSFDISTETVHLTTLKDRSPGDTVNTELAMRPTDRFGGHFVSGHVDGVAGVISIDKRTGEVRMRFKVEPELRELMIYKGSIAVNGISLTIAGLGKDWFEVSLIPHTMDNTTLPKLKIGEAVNIECDMIGKWVKNFVATDDEKQNPDNSSLSMDKLVENLE